MTHLAKVEKLGGKKPEEFYGTGAPLCVDAKSIREQFSRKYPIDCWK